MFFDRPLLRFDVDQSTVFAFGGVFRFSEANFLFFVFAVLAVILFFATSIWGRIWCGYACPQTVFVEWVIRPIEEWLEGPAHQRRHQDNLATWPVSLWGRKVVKHGFFLIVCFVISNTLLCYFYPPETILHWMTRPPAEHPSAFAFMMVVSGLIYFDLSWFREQFCSFLCPYARFQSIMVDQETPIVTYLKSRGEPRGRKAGGGDCIDCGLCVRVCPTGIDIRNGMQLECIQCMRCADACDSIMTNISKPKGLIACVSEASISGAVRRSLRQRPRLYVYMGVLAALVSGLAYRLETRPNLSLNLVRQPGTAYTLLEDGRLANLFTMRTVNNTNHEMPLNFSVEDPPGRKLSVRDVANILNLSKAASNPYWSSSPKKDPLRARSFCAIRRQARSL